MLAAMPPSRLIAHLDMDAFFASVELLRYPQLKGLPVVIGGRRRSEDDVLAAQHASPDQIPVAAFPRLASYTGRGVATTATYEARRFGVGSAIGLMKAAKLCPGAILLPVDFEEVRRMSRLFKQAIREIAPVIQDNGIDEVYIDLTDVPGSDADGGRTLARHIQRRIFEATRLTCSIGLAPNKLLAKLASEFDKPNGISVVTLEDLAARERGWLIDNFGRSHGAWLHEAGRGRDERPVITSREPVSISRETTFERDLHAVHDRANLGAIFTRLCEGVAAAASTRMCRRCATCASMKTASPTKPREISGATRRTSASSARMAAFHPAWRPSGSRQRKTVPCR
jgi:DNA polymerase-4